MRRTAGLDGILTNLRRTARWLWRDTAFTAIAAVTLALGVGSAAAVFGMADRLLLRPLPGVHDSGRTDYLRLATSAGQEIRFTSGDCSRCAPPDIR